MDMKEKVILNKKGFTLLELLIAVSIFGVISVMTFSIMNFVPKLAKTESNQFSERTDVRKALTDITNTIQSAREISFPSIEFTTPDGEKIIYEYYQGNVNKKVDGTPIRLMESVEEFTITSSNYHLFDIHIKTANEGKVYDFKVERRRGGITRTDAEISSISPTTAVFDKNVSLHQEGIEITLSLNGNELNDLWNGTNKLVLGTDYTISGNTLTLNKEYLAALPNATYQITFNVTNGVDPKLTVEIIDTSSDIKFAGNSFEDDIARMNYPGNLEIDPGDSQWIITVTSGTVDSEIDEDDLDITGLPQGIDYTAVWNEGNKIVITLSGTASAPVNTTRSIGVVIKGTGAAPEGSASDSDPIQVLLLPGASFASPERNLLFTNEVYFKNDVTIYGDIVIGRGRDLTEVGTNCNLYGYIYVDSSLNVKNKIIAGTSDKPGKLFIKGSGNFDNGTIYGDLFYRDTLTVKNKFTVNGRVERSAVEIPDVVLPDLKSDQWYIDNGYTVIDSTSSEMDALQSNGKYLFTNSHELRNGNKRLDNVTIVGKANINFSNKFTGSGIIFAPKGEVFFKNGCELTGMCISNRADLQTGSTLRFKRYAELPFD